jgi:hypothetical protein
MKLSPIVRLLVAAAATTVEAISKPSLSLSVNNGDYGGITEGLRPTLKWSGQSTVSGGGGGVNSTTTATTADLDYGFETGDPLRAALPEKLFGSVRTTIGGWGLRVRASKDEDRPVGVSIGATNDSADLDVQVAGTTEAGVQIVSVSKKADLGNSSSVVVHPTYAFGGGDADVVVKYDNDATGTKVQLKASMDEQRATIKQDVGGSTEVSLKASSKGPQRLAVDHTLDATGGTNVALKASTDGAELSVTVSQPLGDSDVIGATLDGDDGLSSVVWNRDLDGSNNGVSTTLKPGESIDVKWNDGGWITSVRAGINGTSIEGVSVSTRREVAF